MASRFGSFQKSDRRPRLWQRFLEFLNEVKRSHIIQAILIDGSFVTAQRDPNDIDLVLVVSKDHNFMADLTAAEYNILAPRWVRKHFRFDIIVVRDGSEELDDAISFFQQVRQVAGMKKGILRIRL